MGLVGKGLLCAKTFPGETKHTCLLIPDRESATNQIPPKSNLVNQQVFLGLLTGI